MAKKMTDEVAYYYYDMHPTEEDLMGETEDHSTLVYYLRGVLTMLFAGQRCSVYYNLNFYYTANRKEYPVAPDIAVIRGVKVGRVRSWRIGKTGPAPHVVLEIASQETWDKDLEEKPSKYAVMGVEEYFAYDPKEPVLLRDGRRLFGWRLDRATRSMRELPLDPQGRLWSRHLESFLVPDGGYLRLYDSTGQLRLTQAEAQALQAETEKQRADVEAEARRTAMRRANAEKRRADAEAEARRAEKQRADALAEKLRSLGIDPDQI
ncbi:MAG: Uma2 family endonuclease [Chloroflexi bacterium]|nr:Uma2 family endonuclease [Chloroflexota bacterium]